MFKLVDADTGELVFEEKYQTTESFRPLFMVPGTESNALVRKLWDFVDTSAENNQKVFVFMNGEVITVQCFYHPSNDGKLIKMGTGLGGARCYRCPATAAEMKNLDLIEEGFPIVNTISVLHAIYHSLADENGIIKTKKGTICI